MAFFAAGREPGDGDGARRPFSQPTWRWLLLPFSASIFSQTSFTNPFSQSASSEGLPIHYWRGLAVCRNRTPPAPDWSDFLRHWSMCWLLNTAFSARLSLFDMGSQMLVLCAAPIGVQGRSLGKWAHIYSCCCSEVRGIYLLILIWGVFGCVQRSLQFHLRFHRSIFSIMRTFRLMEDIYSVSLKLSYFLDQNVSV